MVRFIPFIAINNDGTMSVAQLNIETNGELIIYNSVNKTMDTPVINGGAYIGD